MKRCLLVAVLIFVHNVVGREPVHQEYASLVEKIIHERVVGPQLADVRAQPRLLAIFVIRAHQIPGQPARPRAHL